MEIEGNVVWQQGDFEAFGNQGPSSQSVYEQELEERILASVKAKVLPQIETLQKENAMLKAQVILRPLTSVVASNPLAFDVKRWIDTLASVAGDGAIFGIRAFFGLVSGPCTMLGMSVFFWFFVETVVFARSPLEGLKAVVSHFSDVNQNPLGSADLERPLLSVSGNSRSGNEFVYPQQVPTRRQQVSKLTLVEEDLLTELLQAYPKQKRALLQKFLSDSSSGGLEKMGLPVAISPLDTTSLKTR